jgi:Glycosyl transferase family 2
MALRIDLYTRCWDDAHMLGFFFRHYDALVRRYVVFDDGSTDGSLEILGAHPRVEVRSPLPYRDPDSRVFSALALLDECWKESRGTADWVIVTDIDEHLHHPDIGGYLADCQAKGVTIIPALGYWMISETFPPPDVQLSRAVTLGAPSSEMSKLNIFNPSEVEETHYSPGRHVAALEGHIALPERDELLLLHYKYLDVERLQARHEQYRTRLRTRDFANEWGHQYSWSLDDLRRDWDEKKSRLVDVSRVDLEPWTSHTGPRWWASYRKSSG